MKDGYLWNKPLMKMIRTSEEQQNNEFQIIMDEVGDIREVIMIGDYKLD